MKISKALLSCLMTLALTTLWAPSEAVAGQFTTFSGIECVDEKDTSPNIFYSVGAYNDNKNQADTFLCPITRVDSGASGDISDISIAVLDNHPSQNFRCRIKSCNDSVETCVTGPWSDSYGTGFQTVYLNDISSFYYGNARIECEVPAKLSDRKRSGVLSYSVYD